MIESDHKPGTQETNHDLFQSLPIAECSHTLNGKHLHVRDDDTRIKYPGSNFTRSSYFRKAGSKRKEIFNGLCKCGNIKRIELTV